mmetsp:Transcript_38629/g.27961  ORF Transcript_38629/g.27961 Transcript_38629/m.27961 type:complete len:152 (-) Transcript_38629:79-534(-)|eukprot:CAMPEP_0116876338 /NCGR_PEP_ID=MMETSP0463-20121206/8300_1 /TAXON_ID=181622 /ORGANISM="Strombidinopsis sp, Strain SopsisLIS2011" /LENGTH=151 /DNA_ID=CAMNT_0004522883 /DNA_START=16 /DNA_END=471 /DNA_ORIENTATION=+
MAAKKAGRLTKEMNDLNKNPIAGTTIETVGDDVFKWNVRLDGPEGTPYIGGRFQVLLDFGDSYPFKPPKINFQTKIYHPNIKTDTGEICMQAIENNWVPTLNAKWIIEAVISVMKNPNAENPLEANIAQQFSSNQNQYLATAAEWTAQYAQ